MLVILLLPIIIIVSNLLLVSKSSGSDNKIVVVLSSGIIGGCRGNGDKSNQMSECKDRSSLSSSSYHIISLCIGCNCMASIALRYVKN